MKEKEESVVMFIHLANKHFTGPGIGSGDTAKQGTVPALQALAGQRGQQVRVNSRSLGWALC